MKLILHIGQSKTGTTSIQSSLSYNRELLKKHKILYPDYYYEDIALKCLEHNSLAEELAGFHRYPHLSAEECFQQFEVQFQKYSCETMILSGESFWGAPQIWRLKEGEDFFEIYEKKLRRLKSYIDSYQVHIILYLRPPEIWLETAIPHIIRFQGLSKKTIYESDEQLFELLKPHLNVTKLIQLWENIIEPQKFDIIPFEPEKLDEGDAVKDFWKRAALPAIEEFHKNQVDENKSLDRRYVSVKKELNKSGYKGDKERVIIACLNELNSKLKKVEKYQLDFHLKEKIKLFFEPHLKYLNKNYSEGRESFFSSLLSETKEISDKDIIYKENHQAIEDFWRLYNSPRMRWLYVKMRLKSYLRRRNMPIYLFLKGILKRT